MARKKEKMEQMPFDSIDKPRDEDLTEKRRKSGRRPYTSGGRRVADSKTERPPDLAFEALVEETKAMPEMERGALNAALKAIKAQCHRDGLHPDEIPEEIRRRAKTYREDRDAGFVGLHLTPTALAKHWNRCLPKQEEKKETLPEMYERMKRERQGGP